MRQIFALEEKTDELQVEEKRLNRRIDELLKEKHKVET